MEVYSLEKTPQNIARDPEKRRNNLPENSLQPLVSRDTGSLSPFNRILIKQDLKAGESSEVESTCSHRGPSLIPAPHSAS